MGHKTRVRVTNGPRELRPAARDLLQALAKRGT